MWFRRLAPSCTSGLLADRPPLVRHRSPRLASLAQAHDRRPLKVRTRFPSPPSGSVRNWPISDKPDFQNVSTPVPATKQLLIHSILSLIRLVFWLGPRPRKRFASGRDSTCNAVGSSHVIGSWDRRIPAPPATVMHALSASEGQVAGRDRHAATCPGIGLQAAGWRRTWRSWPGTERTQRCRER